MVAGEKIFDLLDRPLRVVDSGGLRSLRPMRGDVEFKSVGLEYVVGQPVLHDFSLSVPAGTRVAFVGHTGAGKSSGIRLLMRFYDVTSGSVLIDGVDVREIPLEDLRSQIGVVLQNNFLFLGTIFENIVYGRLGATLDEVRHVARLVGIDDFVMSLPSGYESYIGEGGVSLSLGQRQLLAFARALLSNPVILVLDEATSNIDTRTELLIQKGIDQLLLGRTSFVIAHRLSTIVNSDLIVVMDHGRIVEQGSHTYLLSLKGLYYDLYMMNFVGLDEAV